MTNNEYTGLNKINRAKRLNHKVKWSENPNQGLVTRAQKATLNAAPHMAHNYEVLQRELYPKYGSESRALFAYETGARDMEAVSTKAFQGTPDIIAGKTNHNLGNIQGNEYNNFDQKYLGIYNDGRRSEHFSGVDNQGNEWEYMTYTLQDGSTYSFGDDGRTGSNEEFERYTPAQVDYGKALGMNKVPKPQPIPELVPRSKVGSKLNRK